MAKREEIKLPRNALERVNLGQAFAEYDAVLKRNDVFVRTPALAAAEDKNNSHCFFVGRRGTGKTTITKYLESTDPDTIVIRPEIFSPSMPYFAPDQLKEGNARPFMSLTAAFRRTLQAVYLLDWEASHGTRTSLPALLDDELEEIQDLDFDLVLVKTVDSIMLPLTEAREEDWLRARKQPKLVAKSISSCGLAKSHRRTILIDAIDESWDGSEMAVIYLAALMHATLEVNTQAEGIRVLVFLRENIFERVRQIDTEFSRLETCVVGLDWTREQLLEMIERRLGAHLIAKLPLNGGTWNAFFADPDSRSLVFDFCQERPRDVLTYVEFCVSNAQGKKRQRIEREDILEARRRFSVSRLSDLGDEYQENYPQISLVLSRFLGLGRRYTLHGIEAFLARVLQDQEIKQYCARWIYQYSTPERFARLLFDIGFLGFSMPRSGAGARLLFRSLGPRDTTAPPLTAATDLVVHQSYWDALDLQDILVADFPESQGFSVEGLLEDVPGSYSREDYQDLLDTLIDDLRSMPEGRASADDFETLVGDVIKLCFFRWLANIAPQVRTLDGATRRDWVASNRAESGFWSLVRQRYSADQVVFECKNYSDLGASDFQQLTYYLDERSGKLGFVVFRGEVNATVAKHQARILANKGCAIIPLTDKDLLVFLRQAKNGKTKDAHLMDKLDKLQRMV